MGEIYSRIAKTAWESGVRPIVGEIKPHPTGLPFHLAYPNGWLTLPEDLTRFLGGYFYPIKFPKKANPPTLIPDLNITRVALYKSTQGQFIEVFQSLNLPTCFGTSHMFVHQFFLWRGNDTIPEFKVPEFYSGEDEEFDF